ncbi:MAG: phospholipase D-like domain-containing protein [Thermoguttaceae bacterium]
MTTTAFLASDNEDVLWDRLSTLFQGAVVLKIATAFLGAGDEIASWVGQSPERHVEVLVRLEYPTHPDSVSKLRDHPQVTIRAANPAMTPFHEKLFLAIASDGGCSGAYIGSANWTEGGLKKNREAGVWVSEPDVLQQMVSHFDAECRAALPISDHMLADLRSDFLWHTLHGKRPRKDRGTIIASWRDLKDGSNGQFVIKQNGVSSEPFVEGEDEYCDVIRNQSSQMFHNIPSTLRHGLGVVLCRIARRSDGSPDRLIYGRGVIAGIDTKRWRLPEQYLADLWQRNFDPNKIKHVERWPEVLWLDPAECIDYPRGSNRFLWLRDYMDPSFQGGFRWLTADVWESCNHALDEHTDEFGVLPLDRQGIWWNAYLGITADDPLFMTKARMEEMNCGTQVPKL